ncbi:MAG: penicillin-binding protein 1A [Bacillota bacterium]
MNAKRKKRKLNPIRLLIFVLLVFTLMGSGTALALITVSIKDMPALTDEGLLASTSTQIFDQENQPVAKLGIENREPVSLNKIPDNVKNAFLAIEDVRFYRHHGIDFRSIVRAAWSDIRGRNLDQGASTITQQLIKISFLHPEKTFKRKIQEMFLALQLERRYSKDEILEMYLNKIYLGEGAYGIQAAARTYFNKDVEELDLNEAATLAGLPQAPSAYSPYQNYDAALARRNLVLNNMYRYGFISQEQLNQTKQQEIKLEEGGPTGRQYPYPYYVDYITEQLVREFGEDQVFKGGLRVYTSLDTKIQVAAETAMSNSANYPASKKDDQGVIQPQGAMVILDPASGQIKALVGGREHTHKRSFNRASMAPGRQPGSAFKPVISYAPAIELRGMGPASIIDDAPIKYGNWEAKNYDHSHRGLITMRAALTHSNNVAAAKVMVDGVGQADAFQFVRRFGIELDPAKHGPAASLGGLHTGVTPLQLAAAYASFANQGLYYTPTAILRVEAPDGTLLLENNPKPAPVLKPTTAYLITDMLKSVVTSGTGTAAAIGRPAAGKTGTTDKRADIWFAGYTPDYVGVVWIGHDILTPMPVDAFGGGYPARIWRQVMTVAHEGKLVRDFKQPSGLITATVDSKSGLLPGPNTPPEHQVTDLFAVGTVPTETDDTHVLVEVCAVTGKLITDYCPDKLTKVMIKLPYNVPPTVRDYELRVPTETCDIHQEPLWYRPVNGNSNGNGEPWLPERLPGW